MPLLRWTLLTAGTALPLSGEWADPGRLSAKPHGLASRLRGAVELYPCDLLFVHRDAEKQDPQMRHEQCRDALAGLDDPPPAICVVPVRMTEAWLLTSEAAIRRAADNPNGHCLLSLPALNQVENIPDPKQKLHELLRIASEKRGRRLDQFRRDEAARRQRVAELTEDFSPLLKLPSFHRFQHETYVLLHGRGWL